MHQFGAGAAAMGHYARHVRDGNAVFAHHLLAARGLPTTAEEWMGAAVVLGALAAALLVLVPWLIRRSAKESEAGRARLAHESAAFRARWPGEAVWHAPYGELEAEVQRCWQLVLLLEAEHAKQRGSTAAGLAAQLAAVRGWITTTLGPLNSAAAREHRIVG